MTITRTEVQAILEKQRAGEREARERSFFTIKGIDRMMDETYVSDKVYYSKDEAWESCRVSEWVEEWAFNRVDRFMDNSSEIIYRNVQTGEEKKRPGMFAHGDAC